MSGKRLIVGAMVMGVAVPLTIFYLLHQQTLSQFFTIAAITFFSWGVADLLAAILERPRLNDRTPGRAIREDWDRRSADRESTIDRLD